MSNNIIERKHNRSGQLIFLKKENGYWIKQKFKNGMRVYYEDSEGLIEEKRFNRHYELTYEKTTQNGVVIREDKCRN